MTRRGQSVAATTRSISEIKEKRCPNWKTLPRGRGRRRAEDTATFKMEREGITFKFDYGLRKY